MNLKPRRLGAALVVAAALLGSAGPATAQPAKPVPSKPPGKLMPKRPTAHASTAGHAFIMLFTGGQWGAETYPTNIWINLHGTGGDTGWIHLDNGTWTYQRNSIDAFFKDTPDIGTLTGATVFNTGSDAWFLDHILVQTMNPMPSPLITLTANQWVVGPVELKV